MSLRQRETPNAVGVYPYEKMIHRLVFQETLSRSILSEILPIKDVHKKFVSDYILASTDPKMKNPEIVEFLRVLIAVGHPSPRQEGTNVSEEKDDDVDELSEEDVEDEPPGLTNAILDAKEKSKKKRG